LKKLNEALSPEEEAFLQKNKSNEMEEFESATVSLGTALCFLFIACLLVYFSEFRLTY
jgi:hypothetical protein